MTEGLAARAAAARRAFQCGGGRRRREALKGEEVQAGRRGEPVTSAGDGLWRSSLKCDECAGVAEGWRCV